MGVAILKFSARCARDLRFNPLLQFPRSALGVFCVVVSMCVFVCVWLMFVGVFCVVVYL